MDANRLGQSEGGLTPCVARGRPRHRGTCRGVDRHRSGRTTAPDPADGWHGEPNQRAIAAITFQARHSSRTKQSTIIWETGRRPQRRTLTWIVSTATRKIPRSRTSFSRNSRNAPPNVPLARCRSATFHRRGGRTPRRRHFAGESQTRRLARRPHVIGEDGPSQMALEDIAMFRARQQNSAVGHGTCDTRTATTNSCRRRRECGRASRCSRRLKAADTLKAEGINITVINTHIRHAPSVPKGNPPKADSATRSQHSEGVKVRRDQPASLLLALAMVAMCEEGQIAVTTGKQNRLGRQHRNLVPHKLLFLCFPHLFFAG